MSVGDEMKLVFRLGRLGFALGVNDLVEIREDFLGFLDPSSEKTSPLQLGSLPHRGDHIPVYDLKELFGLTGSGAGQALLVVTAASEPWAVVADRIEGIFPGSEFESQPLSLVLSSGMTRPYDTLDIWRGEPLVLCETGKLQTCWEWE